MIRDMQLIQYIQKAGGTGKLSCPVIAQIATASGCSAQTLYMIALGHKQAGSLLAGRIEAATHNLVTRCDLRPDVFGTGKS